jgi:hypothetical protein
VKKLLFIGVALVIAVVAGFVYLFGSGAALHQEEEGSRATAAALVRVRLGLDDVVRLSDRKLVACDHDAIDEYLRGTSWHELDDERGGAGLIYATPDGHVPVKMDTLTSRCASYEVLDDGPAWPRSG